MYLTLSSTPYKWQHFTVSASCISLLETNNSSNNGTLLPACSPASQLIKKKNNPETNKHKKLLGSGLVGQIRNIVSTSTMATTILKATWDKEAKLQARNQGDICEYHLEGGGDGVGCFSPPHCLSFQVKFYLFLPKFVKAKTRRKKIEKNTENIDPVLHIF